MSAFTENVTVKGEDAPFNPERSVAVLYCSNCAEANEVDVFEDNGEYSFSGFVCEKCGHYNTPEDM
ncbi:MAG: hypothetical protein D6E12_11565 [Desulfovibrio sp.]|nr:MAG: hypothetical protein D6E12_11565 [Desulfovibrio sp.]